jgi:hypothetical protein
MHHQHELHTQNLNHRRTLLHLSTAVIALLVHGITPPSVLCVIVIGFVVSAALLWCPYP